jgi:porin
MKSTSLHLRWLQIALTFAAIQSVTVVGALAQSEPASAPATTSSAPVATAAIAQTPHESWSKGKYISGDWGTLRTKLQSHGVDPFVYWTGITSGNPLGGAKQGHVTAVDDFYMGANFDLNKIAGWKGAVLTVSGVNRDGQGLSNDYIQGQYNVQQCVGGQSLFLYEFVLKQSLDKGKVNLKVGRFSASDDLNASPIYSLSLNNGIDGDIRNVLFDTQSSAYPFSTWAGLVKYQPNNKFILQSAVYQTWDNVFNSKTNGTDWSIHGDDGVIYMEQAAWTPMLFKGASDSQKETINGTQSAGLPGHYWLGTTYTPWKGFTPFAVQLAQSQGSANPGSKVGNSYGFYAHADQMVHQKSPGSAQGLTMWTAAAYYPQQNISIIPFQVNFGTFYTGFWNKRPEDKTIFNLIYGKFSRDYAHMEMAQGKGNPLYEVVLEGAHRFQLSRFSFFQPDMQWEVRPGGTGNIRNAIAVGGELGITF